jgi:hypothetical protein
MPLMALVKSEPFCNSATCFEVAVLKSKNVVQLVVIAVVAALVELPVVLVALGDVAGGVVFELDGPLLPQAATVAARAHAPMTVAVCL